MPGWLKRGAELTAHPASESQPPKEKKPKAKEVKGGDGGNHGGDGGKDGIEATAERVGKPSLQPFALLLGEVIAQESQEYDDPVEVSEDEGVELVKDTQGKGEKESGETPPTKASFWEHMRTTLGEESKTPMQYWKEQLEPNYRKHRANRNDIYNIAMEECLGSTGSQQQLSREGDDHSHQASDEAGRGAQGRGFKGATRTRDVPGGRDGKGKRDLSGLGGSARLRELIERGLVPPSVLTGKGASSTFQTYISPLLPQIPVAVLPRESGGRGRSRGGRGRGRAGKGRKQGQPG